MPERELEEAYCDALNRLALAAASDEVGDYLEFGVYVGTSMLCMHRRARPSGSSRSDCMASILSTVCRRSPRPRQRESGSPVGIAPNTASSVST